MNWFAIYFLLLTGASFGLFIGALASRQKPASISAVFTFLFLTVVSGSFAGLILANVLL